MSLFIKEFAKKKIKQLTEKDLLQYSQNYGFSLTENQARDIITYLSTHDFDPFEESERLKMLNDLSHITDQDTANKADTLFHELISSYGLAHLFN